MTDGSGTISADGLVLAGELRVEVAADQVKDGIARIFLFERCGDFESLLVFLIVVVKAERQIEAPFNGCDCAVGNRAAKLPDAFLFVSAWNAHEEAKHLRDGGESVGVVVVE